MKLTTERQQFAEQNEMSMEFVNWFFDEKKESFGNMWFLMAAAMWEAWKGRDSREAQPVVEPYMYELWKFDETIPELERWFLVERSHSKLVASKGQKVVLLYTAPPAPAVVKLPTEFYSGEGIVVRLEEVMAALAVVGVQYERKANAKTRCEFPAPAVPEEMTVEQAYENVQTWHYANGWNACRAAMLAQPVSSGYTFNSPVIPDGWKLVPIDATRAMIDAAQRVEEDGYDAMHKEMLAAVPEGGK